MAEPEDLGDPWEKPGYWDSDELTPEELACLYGAVPADDDASADGRGGPDAAGPAGCPQAEGSTPDLIAAVLAAAGDPALMTDADLIESLARWHSVASRAAGREMRATEELLRRRRPRVRDRRADRAEDKREEPAGTVAAGSAASAAGRTAASAAGADGPERVMPAVVASREAASEIALALTATEYAAQAQAELTADLSRRLPAAFAELDAGRADLARVRVLAEGTGFLSDQDAGRVDALLAPQMGQLTTGDLRDRVRKAVIRIDPGAAERPPACCLIPCPASRRLATWARGTRDQRPARRAWTVPPGGSADPARPNRRGRTSPPQTSPPWTSPPRTSGGPARTAMPRTSMDSLPAMRWRGRRSPRRLAPPHPAAGAFPPGCAPRAWAGSGSPCHGAP